MADAAVETAPPAEQVDVAGTNGNQNGPDAASSEKKEAGDAAKAAPAKDARSHGGRRGGGSSSKDKAQNRKTDYSSLPESSDHSEIRKQVEFYFSDSNLARDNFLFEKTGGPKNVAVPIATIHSFKRMRRFQPLEAVVAALKASSLLDVVDNDTAIKRKTALKADAVTGQSDQVGFKKAFEDAALARTVYAKGFGDEQPTSQFDLEAFFERFGTTNQVRLRRHDDNNFKGSVYVEFDSEASAQAFLAADPPPEYHGKRLTIMSKKAHLQEHGPDGRRGGRPGRNHKDRKGRQNNDRRDWRERRDEDRKRGLPGAAGAAEAAEADGAKAEAPSASDDKKRPRDEDVEADHQPAKRARSGSAEAKAGE